MYTYQFTVQPITIVGFLHEYIPVYCVVQYNTWLFIKLLPSGVVSSTRQSDTCQSAHQTSVRLLVSTEVRPGPLYPCSRHNANRMCDGGGGVGNAKLVERGSHLEHVSILESSATSRLHPHLRLVALPVVWAVVQVLGLDEIQALTNLGRLKLDKV